MGSSDSIVERLKAVKSPALFVLEMQKLSAEASGGDTDAFDALEKMLKEKKGVWDNGPYMSAVFHALSRTNSDRSFAAITDYVENIKTLFPYGAVELISSLISGYGKKAVEPSFQFAASDVLSIRAIGVQTLCALYLEGAADEIDVVRIKSLLENYGEDEYLTGHMADLVLSEMKKEPPDSLLKILEDTQT